MGELGQPNPLLDKTWAGLPAQRPGTLAMEASGGTERGDVERTRPASSLSPPERLWVAHSSSLVSGPDPSRLRGSQGLLLPAGFLLQCLFTSWMPLILILPVPYLLDSSMLCHPHLAASLSLGPCVDLSLLPSSTSKGVLHFCRTGCCTSSIRLDSCCWHVLLPLPASSPILKPHHAARPQSRSARAQCGDPVMPPRVQEAQVMIT